MKIMKNLENAKLLCENENTNDREGEKFIDELELQTIDLDYDTIHSEILDNIIFDENDSGLSDFDITEEEESKKKIFEISKIKTIIHKSVKSLFSECQEDAQFKPLIQNENEINKESMNKEKESENSTDGLIINSENRTQENTDEISEDLKKKDNMNEDNSNDVVEKKKEIINYKKYNVYTDPYSNYNNFTKKYKIKNKIIGLFT